MHLHVRLSSRLFVPLLATALAVLLILAGFAIDRPGNLEAAETVPAGPVTAPAAPATPAAPPPAPAVAPATPATPPAAPVAGPPVAAPETPPAAPAKTKKAAKGKKGKKGAKTPKWQQAAPPGKIAPPGKYNAGEDPEFAKQHGWPVKTPADPAGFNPAGEAYRRLLRQPALQKDGGAGGVPQGRDAAAPESGGGQMGEG